MPKEPQFQSIGLGPALCPPLIPLFGHAANVVAAATACQNISVLSVVNHACRIVVYNFAGWLPSQVPFTDIFFQQFNSPLSLDVHSIDPSFSI
jgi:hypothetical protein